MSVGSWKNWAIYSAFLVAGLFIAFHPTFNSNFKLVQAHAGDTILNHYILEHSWQWLTRPDYAGTLWTAPFFHPTRQTIAYSENLLGTAPIYWGLRLVCDDQLSFQLWMMAVCALTYAAMTCLAKRFIVSPTLAAFCGFVFAFGLPRVYQIGHQQLLPQMFAPLALMALSEFLRKPTVWSLFAALGFLFLQLLAGVYLGWFTAVALLVFAVTYVIVDRETVARLKDFAFTQWRGAAIAVVIVAGLTLALQRPYVKANQGFRRHYMEAELALPRPSRWLSPPHGSPWRSVLEPFSHDNIEQSLFPGLVTLLAVGASLGVVAFRRDWLGEHRMTIVALFWSALVLAALSTRIGNQTAWILIYKFVPGADAIRAPSRIWTGILLLMLPAAFYCVEQCLKRTPAGVRYSLLTLILAFGVAEQYRPNVEAYDPEPFKREVAKLTNGMRGAGVAYVQLDPNANFWLSHLAGMWAGLYANVPVVNGFSGREPFGYFGWQALATDAQVAQWVGASDRGRLVVLPAPALCQDYPALPGVPGNDFLPIKVAADEPCPTLPTKLSQAPANDPPAP